MTLRDLQTWRKRVPFFIFGLCVLPWFLFRSNGFAEVDLAVKIIVPGLALIVVGVAFVALGTLRSRPVTPRSPALA
jgi:hypothetical protein